MPVSAWIGAGIAPPGFTRVDHSELTSKPSTSMTPISVMRAYAGWLPVVSRSTTASGLSRSYVTALARPKDASCMDIYSVTDIMRRTRSRF